MIDLTFENVSKRYIVRRESEADLTLHPWARKVRALRARKESFWALRDVSFEVNRGETLGIIGHNGAGKSTILKLLAGITTPTSGRIVINGRLSALIEVGSGFHPELTGRENLFLNGAILGMTRDETAAKLDSIVEFAGIRPFLDVPVKRFSSGMYVRLGFSIAAHLDPDILLLDEVLAVGDAAFQEKCLTRISELRDAGTSIVFISHDLVAVERICDRVILMRQGTVAAADKPAVVIQEYQDQAVTVMARPDVRSLSSISPLLTTSLRFTADDGTSPARFSTGSPLVAQVAYTSDRAVRDAVVDLLLYSADRVVECQLSTESTGTPFVLPAGEGTLSFECEELGLLQGLYYVDVAVRIRGAADVVHWHDQAAMLRVDHGKVTRGKFYQPHRWTLEIARMPGSRTVSDSRHRVLPTEATPISQ